MDWPTVSLILGGCVAFFTFILGVIKAFKKPDNNIEIETKNKIGEINKEITVIKEKQISQGNRIHDLETHKEIIVKKLDEVSKKLDTLLDKVITFLSRND